MLFWSGGNVTSAGWWFYWPAESAWIYQPGGWRCFLADNEELNSNSYPYRGDACTLTIERCWSGRTSCSWHRLQTLTCLSVSGPAACHGPQSWPACKHSTSLTAHSTQQISLLFSTWRCVKHVALPQRLHCNRACFWHKTHCMVISCDRLRWFGDFQKIKTASDIEGKQFLYLRATQLKIVKLQIDPQKGFPWRWPARYYHIISVTILLYYQKISNNSTSKISDLSKNSW